MAEIVYSGQSKLTGALENQGFESSDVSYESNGSENESEMKVTSQMNDINSNITANPQTKGPNKIPANPQTNGPNKIPAVELKESHLQLLTSNLTGKNLTDSPLDSIFIESGSETILYNDDLSDDFGFEKKKTSEMAVPVVNTQDSNVWSVSISSNVHSDEKIKRKFSFKELFQVKEKRKTVLQYEYIIWAVFLLATVFCIVDRFVMKGDVVLGRNGKRVSKLWGSNFGETLTNVVWAVTARLIITSQNMMFYTALWCIPNLIVEFAPSFLNIDGIRDIHMKMHRFIGIFLIAIPSIAHVLVIFVPPLIDKTSLTYHPPSEFNYSTQWGNLNWTKFYDPAAVENWSFNDDKGIHLTSDELYRFGLMIALFCFVMPISRSKFLNDRSYSLAMLLHSFAGIWYAIDNIRKITHGLAHVFNLPLLLLWCLDRFVSIFLYRRNRASIVQREIIGKQEYLHIRLKMKNKVSKPEANGVGDIYYILQDDGFRSILNTERAHPFTSFSNHSTSNREWDVGFILTVMKDDEQWWPAWTRRLYSQVILKDDLSLTTWGPYRSSVLHLYNSIMREDKLEYIVFGSGSGFGYILDVLGILAYRLEKQRKMIPRILIHFTVRSEGLKNSFHSEIENLLSIIRGRNTAEIKFNWYITSKAAAANTNQNNENLSYENHGRINFEKVLSFAGKDTVVYFVGRPSLVDYVYKLCQKSEIAMIKDFTNSQRGKSDKTMFLKYIKIFLSITFVIVLFCIILSIYISKCDLKFIDTVIVS